MKDLKYLAAFTLPLSALITFYFKGYWSFFTPIYAFILIPVLEVLLPQDTTNIDAETRIKKQKSKFYDGLLYLNVPIVFGLLIYLLIDVTNNGYSSFEIIGLIFSMGIVLGTNGINVAHELGHRTSKAEHVLAKLLLLPSHYMHFFIEHNFGHHEHVATKEDPATARLNQSVYSFWVTSSARQYVKAWKIQLQMLKRSQHAFFSIKNEMFWYVCVQTVYLTVICFVFGNLGFWVVFFAGVVGFLLLETVNYIEHYGLLRKKLPSGRYERVQEVHSWNSNHIIGRIVLYELTRHSDHHYKSSKKYQLLDYHDISPQMPFGYPTSMVLSFIPPLWFSVMNKRVPTWMKSELTHD